jgi:hypothetical protein
MDKAKLSENILNSNLPEKDKEILIHLLNQNDIKDFVKYVLVVYKIGKEILKFFDIDTNE